MNATMAGISRDINVVYLYGALKGCL